MKQFNINIPKGYEIDLEKSDLKQGVIFFKEMKKQYPTSVNKVSGRPFYMNSYGDICENYSPPSINHVSNENRAKAFLALMQLVELRDAWNAIDGCTEEDFDWENSTQSKFCIYLERNEISGTTFYILYKVLHFGLRETRDLFLKTFKDLIEEARELI